MPKENGKVRSEYLLAALMCIAVAFFLTILIVSNSCNVDSPEDGSSAVTSSDPSESSDATESSTSSVQPDPIKVENVPVSDASGSSARVTEGVLVPTYAEGNTSGGELTNMYSFNAKQYTAESEHPYGYSGVKLELREDALRALNSMVTAFNTARGGRSNLIVDKAYSKPDASGDDQAIKENLATGCAVSFSVYPPDGENLGQGKYLWLADNCYNYGYILRYPAEKTSSTHQEGNNRLFRYVGYEHAAYMGQYHLSLEEYLDTLRTYTSVDAPLEITYTNASGNERSCEVYFVSAAGGELSELPIRGGAGTEFTYTGNGTDGIIVTCYTN